MSFRVGVGKKIGGFNFFIGKTISTGGSRSNSNSGVQANSKQPSVKEIKDKEFQDFLYKCERDTNYLIMDFFELNGYDPKRLQREQIDLDDLFADDESYETFSELVLSAKETIERVIYSSDTGIQAKRDISEKIFDLKGFINRYKRREHVNPNYAFLKEPEPVKSIDIHPALMQKEDNWLEKVKSVFSSKSAIGTASNFQSQSKVPNRFVLVLLWIGIFFAPYIFAWFTLSKSFGQKSKLIAFGWMLFVILILIFSEPAATTS